MMSIPPKTPYSRFVGRCICFRIHFHLSCFSFSLRLELNIIRELGGGADRTHDLRRDGAGVRSIRICKHYHGEAAINEHIGFCCEVHRRNDL
jgi:hypothetical protein